MDRKEIKNKVQAIFRDVLDNDNIVLNPNESADDIDDYDSLAHIQIVDAIQKEFMIRLKSKDILSWDTFGEMLDCIEKYLS